MITFLLIQGSTNIKMWKIIRAKLWTSGIGLWQKKKKGKLETKRWQWMVYLCGFDCLNNSTGCPWTPCYVRETDHFLLKSLLVWYSIICKVTESFKISSLFNLDRWQRKPLTWLFSLHSRPGLWPHSLGEWEKSPCILK